MDQIKWCMQQKKGIELVEPSDNLKDAYLIKAEEALDTLKTSNAKDSATLLSSGMRNLCISTTFGNIYGACEACRRSI